MSSNCYVVFEGSNSHWVSKFLDKDINHCYILVVSGENIITINTTVKGPEVFINNNISDILKDSYAIKAEPCAKRHSLLMLNTCVGMVKQHLGISNPFIVTPLQLFKYLRG